MFTGVENKFDVINEVCVLFKNIICMYNLHDGMCNVGGVVTE